MSPTARWAAIALAVVAPPGLAQEVLPQLEPPAVSPSRSVLKTVADKGVSVDGWAADADLVRGGGGLVRTVLSDRVSVRLHRVPGYLRRWKVDHRLRLSLQGPARGVWRWMTRADHERFYDQAAQPATDRPPTTWIPPADASISPIEPGASAGYLSDLSFSHLAAGGAYQWPGVGSASVSLGPVWENRGFGRREGWRVDGDLEGVTPVGDLSGRWWIDEVSHARAWRTAFNLSGEQPLEGGGSDRYRLVWLDTRQRESLGQGGAQFRRDRDLSLDNLLTTAAGRHVGFLWQSRFERKQVERGGTAGSSSDLEADWRNRLEGIWNSARRAVRAEAGLDLQSVRYRDDVAQGRTTLLGMGYSHRFAGRDTLALKARISRFKYDTPSAVDPSDRDELRYLTSGALGLEIDENWAMIWRLQADLQHLVYLHRTRSGENRWIRVLTLSTEVPFRAQNVTNAAGFQTVANYSDYDYPPYDLELSRVYRAFTATDTMRLALSRRWELELSGSYLQDDVGRLNWRTWRQAVSEKGNALGFSCKPTLKVNGWRVGTGWGFYRRRSKQRRPDGGTVLSQDVKSYGPVASLRNPETFGRIMVDFYGDWRWVDDAERGKYRIPDVRFQLSWTL